MLSNENKNPNNVLLASYTGPHLTCSLNTGLGQNLYRSTTSLYHVAIAIIKLLFYSMLTANMTFAFTSDFLFCEQVLLRSRLSSPSMVFRGDPASQDSCSPRALFEACSQTLERIAEEVKNSRTLILALTFFPLVFPCFQERTNAFSLTDPSVFYLTGGRW